MGADVIDIRDIHAALLERPGHGTDGAVALRVRRGHVMGIATHAITQHFRVDGGATGPGSIQRFEHQDSRAFARDHAFTIVVEGLATLWSDGAQPGKSHVRNARERIGATS